MSYARFNNFYETLNKSCIELISYVGLAICYVGLNMSYARLTFIFFHSYHSWHEYSTWRISKFWCSDVLIFWFMTISIFFLLWGCFCQHESALYSNTINMKLLYNIQGQRLYCLHQRGCWQSRQIAQHFSFPLSIRLGSKSRGLFWLESQRYTLILYILMSSTSYTGELRFRRISIKIAKWEA